MFDGPICAMAFSEQEDFYSRLGDQLGATGSLKLVCPGGDSGLWNYLTLVALFGKASWKIEFIGERSKIREKPHG